PRPLVCPRRDRLCRRGLSPGVLRPKPDAGLLCGRGQPEGREAPPEVRYEAEGVKRAVGTRCHCPIGSYRKNSPERKSSTVRCAQWWSKSFWIPRWRWTMALTIAGFVSTTKGRRIGSWTQ